MRLRHPANDPDSGGVGRAPGFPAGAPTLGLGPEIDRGNKISAANPRRVLVARPRGIGAFARVRASAIVLDSAARRARRPALTPIRALRPRPRVRMLARPGFPLSLSVRLKNTHPRRGFGAKGVADSSIMSKALAKMFEPMFASMAKRYQATVGAEHEQVRPAVR